MYIEKKIEKNKKCKKIICQLVETFLLMIALADLFKDDSIYCCTLMSLGQRVETLV